MIVSILQLMGFPMGKAVHSRAGQMPTDRPPKARDGNRGTIDQAQETPARRPEVKAKTGKTSATKSAAKAPVKTVSKSVAKPVAKKPVKAVAKVPAKPLGKTPVKAAAKSPVKAPSKPVAKVAAKKAAVKVVSKPLAKPASKPVPKAPVKKTASSAPVKAAAKKVVKAPAKAANKPVAKPAPKTVSKPAKPVKPVKPAATTAAKVAPVVAAPKEKVPAPMPQTLPKTATAPVVPAAAAVPQKAGRPSSRLAQLTVPSMAQSVASTAAKASYGPSISYPVIVPVLPSSIKKDPKLANNWKTKLVAELTDAELMAMPDSEYMNDVQMAAFRLKLVKLKQDILASAGETTEHLREDTSVVPDPADRATIEEEHALELRTRDRERKLLKKIEQSIARIDAGDYGYCDETGEPIGVGRLLARPTATLSLEAQQRRELKQKMFGD